MVIGIEYLSSSAISLHAEENEEIDMDPRVTPSLRICILKDVERQMDATLLIVDPRRVPRWMPNVYVERDAASTQN